MDYFVRCSLCKSGYFPAWWLKLGAYPLFILLVLSFFYSGYYFHWLVYIENGF